jgi:catechol 2,3-dioxygenase-like lactoylglutathione lyase family enzyme
MYDHISIGVADLDRSTAFYDACLSALGYIQLWKNPRGAGYGPPGFEGEAPFAVVQSKDDVQSPNAAFHIAFSAPDRRAVDAFHAAAVAAGGTDHGSPGIREHYDPGYYAAFVADLDGHRIEAVRHE